MTAFGSHLLFVVSALALAVTGSRLAQRLGACGGFWVLAAIVFAACGACLIAITLGLAGLGGEPTAIALASFFAWFICHRLVPRDATLAGPRAAESWRALPRWVRTSAGAIAGSLLAIAAWCVANPAMAGDGLRYHLPIVAGWVTAGDAPARHAIAADAPLEAYPLTAELLVSWGTGVTRGFAVASLFNPAMLGLTTFAGWCGLRALRVPYAVVLAAVGALISSPLLTAQLNTLTTDTSALAWLVSCAALCVGARGTPGLFVPALLAGALAVGTKTTAAPLVLIVLAGSGYALRARLRGLAKPLAAAGAVSLALGGFWYLRNLVIHGWPLWPFSRGPFGDPLPPAFEPGNESLLSRPGSVAGRIDDYVRFLSGNIALFAGAFAGLAIVRRRAVTLAAGAAAVAFVVWITAPFTAFPPGELYDGLQGSSTRYLLPGIAAAAASVALAAAEGKYAPAFMAVLVVTLAGNAVGNSRLGFLGSFEPAVAFDVDPVLPGLTIVLAGALVGAGAAAVCTRLAAWDGGSRNARLAAGGGLALALAAAGAVGSTGYGERLADQRSSPRWVSWFVDQPGFATGSAPVRFNSRAVGTLAGDRLRHPLELTAGSSTCAEVAEELDGGWVVIEAQAPGAARVEACLAAREPAYADGQVRIYAP